jgi:hypothetical protein
VVGSATSTPLGELDDERGSRNGVWSTTTSSTS